MSSFESLVNGFKIFKATVYPQKKNLITHLMQQGQKATTLVMTSSELRISPDVLTSSNPGELYVIRTPGGLVPPYKATAQATVAGVMFAIQELKVANIVLIGHAKNDAVHKLMLLEGANLDIDNTGLDPLSRWLSIGIPARDIVRNQLKHLPASQQEKMLEKELVLHSMNNLLGYPDVQKLIDEDKLNMYGWHFDVESGTMLCFNTATQQFENLEN